ncbi:MAG: beta-galactosidase, partial [Lachnospiraceae bacterium]|nr:beta-galactosidase [Lachnospiraceae bacterium]
MEGLLYGAAYYDEYMPYERMEEDLRLMKAAGMNTIRIAESTWSTWEPREGEFDFSKLHHMLREAKKAGIRVIVGTPTYAIPPWMVRVVPDILADTHTGRCLYGHRQNMDLLHPKYRYYCERMIRKLLEVTSTYDNVIGYQLDNETKPYDTCSSYAQEAFVQYLKEKFESLEEVNQEFGLSYWSNEVWDWKDFPDVRGSINGSLSAEYKRFLRKVVTDFHAWQRSIVEEYRRENQFITHNFDYEWRNYSHGMQPEVDQYEDGKNFTVIGADLYHPSEDELTGAEIAFGGSLMYSLKRENYLILETQAQGQFGWTPYPGQLLLCAYSHLAQGANSVMYWHWHSIHNAMESYWKGVLSHDLTPGRIYEEAACLGKELARIGESLVNLKKSYGVAILVSHESLVGLDEFPLDAMEEEHPLNYNDILRWIYDGFYDLNVECTFVDATLEKGEDLSDYALVVIPALYSVTEEMIGKLRKYVEGGGHLFSTFRSFMADDCLKIFHDPLPHGMTDVFGLTYDEFTKPSKEGIPKVSHYLELLRATTGSTIASYEHPFWKDYAMVVENHYGMGETTYLGAYVEEEVLHNLLRRVCEQAGISLPKLKPQV